MHMYKILLDRAAPTIILYSNIRVHVLVSPTCLVLKMAGVKEVAKRIADAYEEGAKMPALESAAATRGWDAHGMKVISKWTQKDLKRNKKVSFQKEQFVSINSNGVMELGQGKFLSRQQNV